MRATIICLAAVAGLALASAASGAVTCAAGEHRAGCVGPNGAVTATRPPDNGHRGLVRCADGAYRTACMAPNGAIVGPKPLAKPPEHCSAGIYKPGCVGLKGPGISRR